jgi:hypothetical protein
MTQSTGKKFAGTLTGKSTRKQFPFPPEPLRSFIHLAEIAAALSGGIPKPDDE